MCGAFPTKRPRISGSETHVTSAVSNNAALDSNDALDSAVNRVEQVAPQRAFYGEMAILYAAGWLNATARPPAPRRFSEATLSSVAAAVFTVLKLRTSSSAPAAGAGSWIDAPTKIEPSGLAREVKSRPMLPRNFPGFGATNSRYAGSKRNCKAEASSGSGVGTLTVASKPVLSL